MHFLILLILYNVDSSINQGNQDWFHPLMRQNADQLILDSFHYAVENVMEALLDIALAILCTLGQ